MTGGATVDSDFHLSDSIRATKRRKGATVAGIPAPADQIVKRNVFEQLRQRTTAGLFAVLQLAAKLRSRAADEDHFVFG